MYRRMLVPVDGSELAEVVFTYAKELAGRLDIDIILLHVCRPEERDRLPMHRAYIERAAETVKQQSQSVQEITGLQPGRQAVEVRGDVATGHPAEEILSYADKNSIDLILIATHGRSGVRRWVMGSVADKILRTSKVPVWLVRASIPKEVVYDQWPSRTILVPLDGSKIAEGVLPHVESLAKQRGAELVEVILLRVCEPELITSDYPDASMPLSWDEHLKRQTAYCKQLSAQYMAGIEKQLRDAGLKVRSEIITGASPADEIISYASKNPFNLIVMATHGHSGITRWAYGSVADRVLHGVSSPIFLVRPH
jgi:nucleotide-binding universal stress UspA family protein